MQYEVEQKFPIADDVHLEAQLQERGFVLAAPELQVDRYFAHPSRDFGQTDEALRIRSVGDRNWVTYKGPKIDSQTKTRQEIELRLENGEAAAEGFATLLTALHFRPVRQVRKQRRKGTARIDSQAVEVGLDDVEGLGRFLEIEILCEAPQVDEAKRLIGEIAARLGLGNSERKSYLELLLERE